jgi:hypothetical protein
VTTGAFATVSLTPDLYTSNDIVQPAASGGFCFRDKGRSTLLGFNVTITICDFNLALLEMLRDVAILTDYTTPVEDVGGVISADGSANLNTVMLEWWPANGKTDACAVATTNPRRPYLHYVLPRVNRWEFSGNMDFGDTATPVVLSGYAEPSAAFTESKATDEWTATDQTALRANGVLGWREVTALPALTSVGYDL